MTIPRSGWHCEPCCSPLGYSIVEADSGLAALRCVMAQDFAVILLDVRMPIMDGFETATLIRQRQQSEMTPIIFITAHGSDEIANSDRYAEGAVDFIFAPVPPDELRAKVSVFANLFIKADGLAKQAAELKTSADQLRLLTEAAPIGIFQTDAQNRYVYTNPRWTEITGIPREEAEGQEWDAIMGSEARAGLIAELRRRCRVPGGALPSVRDPGPGLGLSDRARDLEAHPGRQRWDRGLGRHPRRRHGRGGGRGRDVRSLATRRPKRRG